LCRYRVIGAPIAFNDFSLQKYPCSAPEQKYAISPHLDHKRCINLIVVYLLKGKAPFCVCRDRAGNGAEEIKASPGDAILMRGSGFDGNLLRPFHYIGAVSEERLTFGMRQTIDQKPIEK